MSTPSSPPDPDQPDRVSSDPPADASTPAGGSDAEGGSAGPGPGLTAEPSDVSGAPGPGAPPPPGPDAAGPTGPAADHAAGDGPTDRPGSRSADGPDGPAGPPPPPPGSGPWDPPPGSDGGWGPWSQARVRGRRLDRRTDDRVVAGVAGGLGDAFGVDPAIFRLTFVTLSFFGGGGMVLYALGWLFMPARDSRESIGEGVLRRAGGPRSAGGIALIAVAVLIVVNSLGNVGGGLVWGAVIVAIGVLVFRSDGSGGVPRLASAGTRFGAQGAAGEQSPPAGPSTAHQAAGVHGAGGMGTAPPPAAPPPVDAPRPDPDEAALHEAALRELDELTAAYAAPPPTMPPPVVDDGWRPRPLAPQPPPPRPPSILGRVTVAATLIAIGTLALFDNLTALNVAIASYAAVALLIVGGGLLVGAVVGRARGLIPLGGVALVVMLIASLAPQLPAVPAGGAGDRVYVPETIAELQPTYQLGAGELRLDLTQLELESGDDVEIDVTMGLGEMTVLVPPEVGVDVDADMRIGAIDALGRTSEGPGAATAFTASATEGHPTIDLDLVNGAGEIAVRRIYPEEAS